MIRTAWRTGIPGFLLLLAICSEASAAYVGDPTLATTNAADFSIPPYLVRLPDTATTHEFDVPSTYSRFVTRGLAAFFTETFRIPATDQIRTGREGTI